MTDLPQHPKPIQDPASPQYGIPMTPGIGKEGESISFPTGEIAIQDMGKEMDIPKEVESAGVHIQPQTVTIPQPIQQFGVHATGSAAAVTLSPNAMPLTERQIAEGLHENIINSIRWLAEWCRRKLMQLKVTKK